MERLLAFLLLLIAVSRTGADQKSFDCKMRQLAIDYARKLQPDRSKMHFQQIADALNGAQEAQDCNVSVEHIPDDHPDRPKFPVFELPKAGKMLYVDASKGKDTNAGTESLPLQTIGHAVEVARGSGGATIILRAGTFYLAEAIVLGAADSNLVFQNYNGEEVWVSGAMPVNPKWSAFNTSGANVYVADLSALKLDEVLGMRVNGMRAIRARYPNADPEMGFGSSLKAKHWLPPIHPPKPDKDIFPAEPLRNTTPRMFQRYVLGIGGSCDGFTPPAGYWCSSNTAGGGGVTYRITSGMVVDKSVLPHMPYKDGSTAIIQAWRPGHWASWMFDVSKYDAGSGTFTFGKGGFQGARGNDNGDEFYIENVMEELDSPNEWFYDAKTAKMYFWYNGTGMPPASTVYEIPHIKVLINATGTQKAAVKGIQFKGINFRDTAYTYLDPHGMPSGGDWGLQRTAALFFEGTEQVVVDSCLFSRLDGNALMLSGYNREAVIENNEFVWIGDSAIAQWGYTSGTEVYGFGWDGTDGNQPRGTQIIGNFVHELGIWEKQSSFYFQAKSCQNLLERNIFFNGPRAGINFNDGFGGGSNISENLLMNTCRESGDHGPFNSWDRQVFVTKVGDGKTASVIKAYDNIERNFMIANYNSQEAIDNDDGSCYFETHNNFFAYSGNGMKNDFDGHDNHHHDNIYAYVGSGFRICAQLEGHNDMFYGNTVVLKQDGDYGRGTCSGPGKTVVHDNKIYTPTGKVTECGKPLAEWQKEGNDKGTTAAPYPPDETLVSAISELLDIKTNLLD
ncbi:uncharacterized protein LOC135814571 [Sycon ciliatum]|uniref:uncharacterized protein LOC135814571 n=1 Tax=Sycon ciliatum TaxID=27933 RepID=UPI0031F600C4